jgi:tetratricopeptide (TPR) repeat protein
MLKICIGNITRGYNESERRDLGIVGVPFTDEINSAYLSLLGGKLHEAREKLRKALARISLDRDPQTIDKYLASNLFNRALTDKRNRQKYFDEALSLDPEIKANIKAFTERDRITQLIEEGNALAERQDVDGAIKKYQEAIALDQSLKDRLDPIVEAKKRASGQKSPPPSPANSQD